MFVIKFGYSRCTLSEGSSKVVLPALRFVDPNAHNSREFREGMTDGKILFYDRTTRSFPTGFLRRVVKRCKRKGHEVKVVYPDDMEPISLKGLRPDMLFGLTLREHQFRGVKAAITEERGCLWHATNAGKSPQAAAICLHLKRVCSAQSLILVPNKGLLHQTSKDIRAMCGGEVKVGLLGDGRDSGGDIIVAITASVIRGCAAYVNEHNSRLDGSNAFRQSKRRGGRKIVFNKRVARMLLNVKCLIIDEGHHASAATWKAILDATPNARHRIAMTGSAMTKNKIKDLTFRAYVGPVIDRVTNKYLMDKGYSARAMVYGQTDSWIYPRDLTVPSNVVRVKDRHSGEWRAIRIPDGKKRYRLEMDALLKSRRYNKAVVLVAKSMVEASLKPLILTTSIKHLLLLKTMFEEAGLNPVSIWGDVDGKRRISLVRRFSADPQSVLLGSTVFDEGFNAAAVGSLILAAQGKGLAKLLQRVGRSVRAKESGLNFVAIVDMLASNGEFLPKHSEERLSIYREEGFEVELVTDLHDFLSRARRGWRGLLGEKRYEKERTMQKQHVA